MFLLLNSSLHSSMMFSGGWVWLCVCARVCVCVRVGVRVLVGVRVRVSVRVHVGVGVRVYMCASIDFFVTLAQYSSLWLQGHDPLWQLLTFAFICPLCVYVDNVHQMAGLWLTIFVV